MELYGSIKKKKGGFPTLNPTPYVFNEILSPWKPFHHSAIDNIEVFLQTLTSKTSINDE